MRTSGLWLTMCFLAGAVGAKQDEITPDRQAALIETVRPGVVIVEYRLRYDQGEAPKDADEVYLCHNCGGRHTRQVGETVIKEERPLEAEGFLVSPTTVVTRDVGVQDRFIESIRVKQGETAVPARMTGWATDQNAAFLELQGQIEASRPLSFKPDAKGPYVAITYTRDEAEWKMRSQALPTDVSVSTGKPKIAGIPSSCVIVSADGGPVAVWMKDELPIDDSWKAEPRTWLAVSEKEHADKIAQIGKLADGALLHVALKFRSPKAKGSDDMFDARRYIYRSGRDDNAASDTEMDVIGMVVGEKDVLVLADIPPDRTARLEKIRVVAADGKAREARFKTSLTEYGGFIVATDAPIGAPLRVCASDIRSLKNALLFKAEVRMAGERRFSRVWHGRITSFGVGYKDMSYPWITGEEKSMFMFTREGELATFPFSVRQKVALKSSERWSSPPSAVSMPATLIAAITSDIPGLADKANVPRSEDQEEKIAWMGVVLQGMDPLLARANKASKQTRNGETGALVSFVYPDSPAAKADVRPGMILLRLITAGQPKPIDVKIEEREAYSFHSALEEMDDDVPPEYLENIPPPWPSVANSFNHMLTELGFGAKYAAVFLDNGEETTKNFVVAGSPPHYDEAAKFKSEQLGLTVRDLTFEVRRHFQKKPEDPGIVVSKVEPGGKAAVARIRPYEVITHLNNQPVMNVKEFEKNVSQSRQLVMTVSRMTTSRQVRITLDDKPAEAKKGKNR